MNALVAPATPGGEVDETAQTRVLDAALTCLGRWGVAKTTVDDIARESGVSRASIYRHFVGGKAAIIAELSQRETALCVDAICSAMWAADTLVDAIVAGAHASATLTLEHPIIRQIVEHDRDRLMGYLAFDRIDPVLAAGVGICSPALARFLSPAEASEACEWIARFALSFTLQPGSADLLDIASIRRFVETYLPPGLNIANHSVITETQGDPHD
jgi:AcrR family transcriptional regulator